MDGLAVNTYLDWLNQNAVRAYPLAEYTSAADDAGVRLPDTLLLDLSVLCPDVTQTVRVTQVWYSPSLMGMSLSIGDTPAATAMVVRSAYKRGTAVPLVPYPDALDIQGWVVFGDPPRAATSRVVHTFSTAAQGRVDPGAVRGIRPPGVSSIDAATGAARARNLVRVVADGQLRVYRDPGDPQVIRVAIASATAGRDFLGPCNDTACAVPPVRSINGVCPDASGVITLQFEAGA